MHVSISYTTIGTLINEGTGIVSYVFAHSVCTVSVGLMGLICSVLFKSDRGALSAKELRETLLTTRSSSERSL